MVSDRFYKQQQKTAEMKGQMTFGFGGSLEESKTVKIPEPKKEPKVKKVKEEKKALEGVKIEVKIDTERHANCPFCLHIGKVGEFLVYKEDDFEKKAPSSGKAKCPECGAGMLMKTAVTKFNADSFADFVFSYKGFFYKINKPVWNARLQALGWTADFWKRYKLQKNGGEQSPYSSEPIQSTSSSFSSSDYPEGCSGELPPEY